MIFVIDNCLIIVEYIDFIINITIIFLNTIYKKKIDESTILGNITFEDGSLHLFYKTLCDTLFNFSEYEKAKTMHPILMKEFVRIDLCEHKSNMTIMWIMKSLPHMICISVPISGMYGDLLCYQCIEYLKHNINKVQKNRLRLDWKYEGFIIGTKRVTFVSFTY